MTAMSSNVVEVIKRSINSTTDQNTMRWQCKNLYSLLHVMLTGQLLWFNTWILHWWIINVHCFSMQKCEMNYKDGDTINIWDYGEAFKYRWTTTATSHNGEEQDSIHFRCASQLYVTASTPSHDHAPACSSFSCRNNESEEWVLTNECFVYKISFLY
jgi:hypothetical protein